MPGRVGPVLPTGRCPGAPKGRRPAASPVPPAAEPPVSTAGRGRRFPAARGFLRGVGDGAAGRFSLLRPDLGKTGDVFPDRVRPGENPNFPAPNPLTSMKRDTNNGYRPLGSAPKRSGEDPLLGGGCLPPLLPSSGWPPFIPQQEIFEPPDRRPFPGRADQVTGTFTADGSSPTRATPGGAGVRAGAPAPHPRRARLRRLEPALEGLGCVRAPWLFTAKELAWRLEPPRGRGACGRPGPEFFPPPHAAGSKLSVIRSSSAAPVCSQSSSGYTRNSA